MRWLCLGALCLSGSALADDLHLDLRNDEGEEVLNGILDASGGFWNEAWIKEYQNKTYDEIRLKSMDSGYVPMITGEGLQDFDHEVVAEVVFEKNTKLPKYMSGAKVILDLGHGHDSTVGADYRDTLYVLDLTLFYATFPQRMYRKHDATTNTTVLWFEKLEPSWVPAATWTRYKSDMDTAIEGMSTRWIGSSIVPVDEIYGMFVVKPGDTRKTRVSFISKVSFGEDAGWIAKMGSQMPGVLKSGLRSGFGASVAIAADEQAKRL